MKATRVQIVGRIPADLKSRARAAAKRRRVSLNTFLVEALTGALVAPHRVTEPKEPQ